MKSFLPIFIVTILVVAGISFYTQHKNSIQNIQQTVTNSFDEELNEGGPNLNPHPLSIQSLRNGEYPGSELTVEQNLTPGSNYQRYIASYKSEGLKIYGLLTIPNGTPPETGWPVIIFNHGYIPPAQYRTTERYVAYTDAFSRNGYILFRPDYRGHGNSEGSATGGYGSNAYTIDVLNAVSSVKRYNEQVSSGKKIVDVNRIGMWGHSMGGQVTLRSMVTTKDVKAGVIWAGVVAPYSDLVTLWRRTTTSPQPTTTAARRWRQQLIEEFGQPETNTQFWNSISANSYLSDISGPLQIHHGTADTSVPVGFSETLERQMRESGKDVELYIYPGDDHNLSKNFSSAINRSVSYFDKYLK